MLLAKNVPAGNTPLRRVDRLATVAQLGKQLIQVELDVMIALQVNSDPIPKAVANLVRVVNMVVQYHRLRQINANLVSKVNSRLIQVRLNVQNVIVVIICQQERVFQKLNVLNVRLLQSTVPVHVRVVFLVRLVRLVHVLNVRVVHLQVVISRVAKIVQGVIGVLH